MSNLIIVADENIPFVAEFFQTLGEVRRFPGRTLSAEQVRDADILLVRSVTPVNAQLLDGSAVQFVGTCTIGIDHLDVDYLTRRGIAYSSAPGCNANSVVEYVFSVLAQQKPDWLQATFGIIGCGNVGGHLHRRLQVLGSATQGSATQKLTTWCYDPFLTAADNSDLCTLEQVLRADVVCLHTPLTLDGDHPSYHLLSEQELQHLPHGCLLINAGRGPAIDNQALKKILARRPDLTAVLDVWEPEPNLDIELMQQVALASPHIAGYSYDGKVEGTAMIYRALCRHLGREEVIATAELLRDDPSGQQTLVMPTAADRDIQTLVNDIILQAYNVRADDLRMRELLLSDACQASAEAFAQGFDALRKHYPKRREFACFEVDLQGVAESQKKPLSAVLAALGFTLNH